MSRAGPIAILLLLAAAWAHADVVVERWGVSGRLQHPKALKYELLGSEGRLLVFDLSALPGRTKIYHARLLFQRNSGSYDRGFDVVAVESRDEKGGVKLADRPLQLAPPYYRWFDVTDFVRAQAGSGEKAVSLLVRSAPRFDRNGTILEITYEGKLKDPPEQVAGMQALYRSGQVFISFKEIEDLCEGEEAFRWVELKKKIKSYSAEAIVPNDDKREIRYRVYRHDEPITAESIGAAKLLGELVPGSCINTRTVIRWPIGETGRSVLDKEFRVMRVGVDGKQSVPPGTGVYVHTVGKPGRGYYAVVTCVNGVANTADLSQANTAGPVEEKVAPPEPVMYKQIVRQVGRDKQTHLEQWHSYWADQPLAPRPLRYDVIVQHCPDSLAKPARLQVSHRNDWSSYPQPTPTNSPFSHIILTPSDEQPMSYWMGINDAYATLKGIEHGKWRPFTQRRQEALIRWVKSRWAIDEQRIDVDMGVWGMMEIERPDLYSWLVGWGQPEFTKGFQCWNRANGVWGPPGAYADRPDQENVYYRQDYGNYVTLDPSREMPYLLIRSSTGAHNTEMGWPPFPRFFRAMVQTKRAFAASWGKHSWIWPNTPVLRAVTSGQIDITRDMSLPAFANCTLDNNPGCGDLREGDYSGQINGYLLWDTKTIADEPGRWEMTIWVDGSAPLPDCTVDLTPRRCQKFRLPAGADFKWENVNETGGVLASGAGKADKHGLATVGGLKITKARHRIRIHR